MSMNYTREQVLKAIKGSGGITSTVARRLQCDWHTAQRYVQKWAGTRQAFDAENEAIVDLAESVLLKNIQLASQVQQQGEMVDTKDAKYVLSTRGKDRGYSERQEIDLRNVDLSQLTEHQLERLANGDDLLRVLADPGTG